jgi:RNA polymerase sigma factor (sigma-70 family)
MPSAAVRKDEALSQEFEELFLEHSPLVYRTAYAITGHRQDAEDVLQCIFVKLLERGLTPDGLQHPARYFHRAAVNVSLNVLRDRRRRKLVDDLDLLEIAASPGGGDETSDSDPRHQQLMDAMARLSPQALEILLLHYTHEYSDAKIAALMGKSRGAVAVMLYRIRRRLRAMLRSAGLPAGSSRRSAGSAKAEASAKAGSDGAKT